MSGGEGDEDGASTVTALACERADDVATLRVNRRRFGTDTLRNGGTLF